MTKIVVRAPDNNLACKSEKGGLNWAKVFFLFVFFISSCAMLSRQKRICLPRSNDADPPPGFFFPSMSFLYLFFSSSFFVELKNVKV